MPARWALIFALLVAVQWGEAALDEDEGYGDVDEMLKKFDADGDGKLELEEMKAGFKALADEHGEGHDILEDHLETVGKLFANSDKDGDGALDLEELRHLEGAYDDDQMNK